MTRIAQVVTGRCRSAAEEVGYARQCSRVVWPSTGGVFPCWSHCPWLAATAPARASVHSASRARHRRTPCTANAVPASCQASTTLVRHGYCCDWTLRDITDDGHAGGAPEARGGSGLSGAWRVTAQCTSAWGEGLQGAGAPPEAAGRPCPLFRLPPSKPHPLKLPIARRFADCGYRRRLHGPGGAGPLRFFSVHRPDL